MLLMSCARSETFSNFEEQAGKRSVRKKREKLERKKVQRVFNLFKLFIYLI